MLKARCHLLFFLMIVATVFNTPTLAADPDQTLSETITLTGVLEILMADNFETGISKRRYTVRVKEADGGYRSIPLSFASMLPDSTLRTGHRVTIKGRLTGNTIAVDSLQRDPGASAADVQIRSDLNMQAPLTIEDRNAILLIVSMNDADNTHTVSELTGQMYSNPKSTNGLFQASSFGQLSFDPDTDGNGDADVFGPFKINDNAKDDCDTIAWADAADRAAEQADINLSQYQHRIYSLPDEANCNWAGEGHVRCENDCRVWIKRSRGEVFAHELGHNIGWRHSSVDLNADGVIANVDINKNGRIDREEDEEYGDWSGIMGMPKWAQANAPHRDQKKWFDAYPGALVTTTCSNTFELHALELDPGVDTVGTQVVKIPIANTGSYYYLSYRRAIGPYPSYSDYADKINIHRLDGDWDNTIHMTNLEQSGVFQDAANGITVTAANAGGEIATVTVDVPNEPPTADYSYTTMGLDVRFNDDSSDGDGTIASHLWDFGDGESSTLADPNHIFASAGTYTVELTVTDDCNQTGNVQYDIKVAPNLAPTAEFTSTLNKLNAQFSNASNDSDGTIASYQWDFDDGNISNQENPSHTYAAAGTYMVKLTVTDDDNATDTVAHEITAVANKPPDVKFDYTANDLTIQFTDTSEDSDGGLASHLWKFGDGLTSIEANPSHTYASAGTFNVQLTVTDDDGESNTEIKTIAVNTVNVPPTADFSLRADRLNVVFTNASTDSDGTIASYQWDFGDGGTSDQENSNHTYAAPGTYTVALAVADNSGAGDTETRSITVDVVNVAPAAGFTFTSDGLGVQFSDTSTDNDGTIASHQWDFGDGEVSDQISPDHTYPSAGTYTVQLTVTDDDGAINTSTDEVTVDVISPLVIPGNTGGGGGGGGGCFIGDLF